MNRPFKNQVKNVLTKFVASSLVVTLGCSNFLLCGNYLVTYAAENRAELDKQTDATLNKNVKFDAYFIEGGNKTHYKIADLNTDIPELVMATNVEKEGYLKNATIDLKNEENQNELNYTVIDIEDNNAIVQSASENQLVLRQINAGNKLEFTAKLAAGLKKIDNIEKLDSISKITLKGLYVNGQGEETPIEKEVKINMTWNAHYEAMIKQTFTKYIPMENAEEGKNKTLISMQVETGLQEQKFMLPIKETNVEINVPIINNEKPKSVTVNAISLEATNGQTSDSLKFTEENWKYDETEGKININVKNEDLKFGKNLDSYIVNYVYSNEVYKYLLNNKVIIQSKSNVKIKTFTDEEIEKEIADEITLEEAFGKLISLQGESITQTISKGKLYANINNPQSNDNVQYEYKWNINVGFTDGLNGIALKETNEVMATSNNMIGTLTGKTQYRQITFNSASFDELLGEEGTVSIYDNNGNLLALVGKDSRTDSNGNYLVDFPDGIEEIEITTSKPVKTGNLSINIKKEIKSDLGFAKSQIDNFEKIIVVSQVIQIDETTGVSTAVEEKNVEIALEATVTKSKISINKDKLSTLVKNENIEMTIELGNDDETSDFYVDPIFEIELPKVVENVEIIDARILFDDVLILDKAEFVKENGTPILRVALKGVQTKYNMGLATNGTNILLRTNIFVNNLAPSSVDEIKMYYYNSNTRNYFNGVQTSRGIGGLATTNIEFVAPVGMITVNAMENYDGNGNSALTLHQGNVINLVETYKPARIMKMNLITINNTGNTCTDVVTIGRIPFAGNKDLATGEELGTTIDTYLRSYITSSDLQGDGIKVYYSENGFATTAVADEANGWTLTPTDLSKVKSFMIVLQGYEMKQGDMFTFSYEIEYPSNVGYNNSVASNYGVYYINNTQVASVSSFAKSDIIGITTGRGPELEVNQRIEGVNEEGTIEAFHILKYIIEVKNTGTESATNVKIENKIPKWTSLVRATSEGTMQYSNMEVYDYTKDNMNEWNVIKNPDPEDLTDTPTVGWTIPTILPGETIVREVLVATSMPPDAYMYYYNYPGFVASDDGKYYITTQKYNAETDTTYQEYNEITEVPDIAVQNITLVSADNINVILKSSSEEVEVENNGITIQEYEQIANKNAVLEEDRLTFTVALANTTEEEVKNIKLSKYIPEGLIFINANKYIYPETEVNTDYGSTEDFLETLTGNEAIDRETLDKYNESVTASLTQNNSDASNVDYSSMFPTTEAIGEYNDSTRQYEVKIDSLPSGKSITIAIVLKVDYFETGIYERYIKTNSKYELEDGTTGETTPIEFTVIKPHYTVKQEVSNNNSILSAGDKVTITYTVENVGKTTIGGLRLKLNIPDEFHFYNAKYTVTMESSEGNMETENSVDYLVDGELTVTLIIPEGLTSVIKIEIEAQEVTEDTAVFISGEFTGEKYETTFLDLITYTIEKSPNASSNSGTTPKPSDGNTNTGEVSKYYKIGGMVWVDENEDGKKDDNEKLLPNIQVGVYNERNEEVINTATDEMGRYLLTNLSEGKYFVIFKYDEKIYGTTIYETPNTPELYNSNAIEKEIIENGQTFKAAVTDTIDLNQTLSDVNLGLIEKSKFDLKLEKYITKITVQNGQGVKEYNFDNSKLAKVEVPASQIAKTTAVIEYTIKVTNEGNIPGYAKNIVDYKLAELNFNSGLNNEWYAGNDGNVYTTTLQNTLINPGESKEVKLVLTKSMNSNNVGFTNNVAEIYEAYNEYGLDDKNSTPANNAQGENDRSSADSAIIVKTGEQAIYIVLAIIVLLIIITGVATIKKITGGREKIIK